MPALVKKANTRPRLIGSAPVDRPTASEQPRFRAADDLEYPAGETRIAPPFTNFLTKSPMQTRMLNCL